MTSFRNLKQATGRTLSLDGTEYLFFGGTAYLGLLVNPAYIELFKKGIDIYGLNNGTSRSNNVQLGIYQEAENNLANRFGFQAAALLSSGYLAAQVAVHALTAGKAVIYAPGSHPSLWLTETPQEQRPFEEWIQHTVSQINESQDHEFVIISNCIDNLGPQKFDFSALRKIDYNKKVTLILDDSHGLAVLAENEVSTDWRSLCSDSLEVVLLASLAKGLGTDAGVVMGTQKSIDIIKKHPIFNGASPSSPAAVYALVYSEHIYTEYFAKMQKNNELLSDLTRETNLNHIPNFPVFSSKDPHLYKHLVQQNILISSFPYPLSSSPLLNRIVVSALHTEDDIRHIGEILLSEISLKL